MKKDFKTIKKNSFPYINEPDSDEAKLSANIIGSLLEMEKFRFVSNKVVAEVVHETVKAVSKLMGR